MSFYGNIVELDETIEMSVEQQSTLIEEVATENLAVEMLNNENSGFALPTISKIAFVETDVSKLLVISLSNWSIQ